MRLAEALSREGVEALNWLPAELPSDCEAVATNDSGVSWDLALPRPLMRVRGVRVTDRRMVAVSRGTRPKSPAQKYCIGGRGGVNLS